MFFPGRPCPLLRNARSRRGAPAPTTASTVMHGIHRVETGQIMTRIADHGQPCLRSYNDALCARKRPWMGISMPFPAPVQLISTDINLPTATSATPLHELMAIIPHLPPFVKIVLLVSSPFSFSKTSEPRHLCLPDPPSTQVDGRRPAPPSRRFEPAGCSPSPHRR